MSIKSVAIGTYTKQLTIEGGSTHDEVIAAVDLAITASGWEQYDISNPRDRVYRSLNKDGVTYKYIKISFDVSKFTINTTSYEFWNPETHVGTNEVYTNNGSGIMGYAFDMCDIIVMTSERWLLLQTFIRNQAGPWSGVVELARDAVENTPENGFPCWIWISSVNALAGRSGRERYAALPRTRTGLTGEMAVVNGWQIPYTRIASGSLDGRALTKYVTYAWDTTKKIVHAARPTVGDTEMHGRMFGLKMTYNIGSSFNRVKLPIDMDYFYAADGEEAEHWVLAANPITSPDEWLSTTGAPSGGVVKTSVSVGTTYWVEPVGSNFYLARSSDIAKVDASGTTMGSPVAITGSSGVYFHLQYDGNRFLYGASSVGVTRIDTKNDDAVSVLPLVDGSQRLLFDGTWLWSVPRASRVTNVLSKIDPVTFEVVAEIPLSVAFTPSELFADINGNVYVGSELTHLIKVNTDDEIEFSKIIASGHSIASFLYNGKDIELMYYHTSNYYLYHVLLDTNGEVIKNMSMFTGSSSNRVYTSSGRPNDIKLGRHVMSTNGYSSTSYSSTRISSFAVGDNEIVSPGHGTNDLYNITHAGSDQNRLWYIYNNTTLFYVTNLFNGDNGSVGYGRFLLPK